MVSDTTLKNVLIALVAPIPSILFYLYFLEHYNEDEGVWNWCYKQPLLFVNALYFVNVNILFWIIGHFQSRHWMMDLFWSVIPVFVVHFFVSHPLMQYNVMRSRIFTVLTWVWGLRMTHVYLRHENWECGVRQDWRWNDMSQQLGKHWWWISFFAVYVSQQVFVMGICLPLYAIHSVDKPLNVWDFIAIFLCLSGMIIAYFADTQIYSFMSRNEKLKELGKPMVPVLDQGVWRYSRHPNYFGEQLWWWGLVIPAWALGQGWTFIGSFINSTCLVYVTFLVEKRMLKQAYRAEAYKRYQKETSMWIPWSYVLFFNFHI